MVVLLVLIEMEKNQLMVVFFAVRKALVNILKNVIPFLNKYEIILKATAQNGMVQSVQLSSLNSPLYFYSVPILPFSLFFVNCQLL